MTLYFSKGYLNVSSKNKDPSNRRHERENPGWWWSSSCNSPVKLGDSPFKAVSE
jgi:hypothetical protein